MENRATQRGDAFLKTMIEGLAPLTRLAGIECLLNNTFDAAGGHEALNEEVSQTGRTGLVDSDRQRNRKT
jgi:hypothetical protein